MPAAAYIKGFIPSSSDASLGVMLPCEPILALLLRP